MSKAIKPIDHINEKTQIVECTDGFWLYDENRGMNLAMRASSEKAALIKALEYYQRRLIEVEAENQSTNARINAFLESLGINEHARQGPPQ